MNQKCGATQKPLPLLYFRRAALEEQLEALHQAAPLLDLVTSRQALEDFLPAQVGQGETQRPARAFAVAGGRGQLDADVSRLGSHPDTNVPAVRARRRCRAEYSSRACSPAT